MNDADTDVLARMADAYVAFLSCLPWDRPLVLRGAKEGLNKFLSNAYLCSFRARRKHELTQLISITARARLNAGDRTGLVFEHVVPKRRIIQEPCERLAREGKLTTQFVLGLLRRYWVLATVTTAEDRQLARMAMPTGWDGVDVLARYAAAGIDLVTNPFAAQGVPSYALPESAGRPTNGIWTPPVK